MVYFFSMQCPDCSYISFKQAKSCSSCGFDFKKSTASAASLFRNDSFTIFAAPAKEHESSGAPTLQTEEDVAVIEAPEISQESPELESGEFLLNLPNTEQDLSATTLKLDSSGSSANEFVPMEFGSEADINLEEMEVEGLGLGLEPFDDETPATAQAEPEEIPIEISQEPEVVDLTSDDITLKTEDLDELSLDEDVGMKQDDDVLEIAPSQNLEQDLAEPMAPVLDLGDTEISLDLDEGFEPESPAEEPSPPPVQIDELEIKLEIDDSEGPLIISNDETPEIEIDDLGLELEDSSDPENP